VGSGRKRSDVREVFDTAITKAEKQIAAELPSLLSNMLVLANGVAIQDTNSEGEPVVYTRPPDRAANEYLINRVMGKPIEKSESDVNLTGGVTIFLPQRKTVD
jgi:hypothetical protein